MGFLRELWRLTRFEHALMLAFAVLIAETIITGRIPPTEYQIVFSLLVPIFSEMGSFALNDYFDIETDRMNKKDGPLVKGTISPKFAMWFSIICLLLSTIFGLLVNTSVFAIALVFNFLAVIYNWKLKDLPLLGNLYIALTMAIPFIFGNFVVSDSLSPVALVLALLGFVAGLAREILKSVQDMAGDVKARGSKTLPVVIGKGASIAVAILLYILFIPLTAAPFYLGLRIGVVPLLLVALADLIVLAICLQIIAKKDYRFARNFSLVAFFVGMLGILLAALS